MLPGAHEAIAAVRRHRGRVVVVTGKFPDNARRHVDHLGLDVDHLEGWVWGVGKADALLREGASIYVGDHVHDVEGALAAGALSVSVLTGGCTREELLEAGTDVVLDSLEEFPAWLDEHLLTTRLAALEADLRDRGSVLVAYSGGADSAFLLAAAVRALGPDRVAAATGYSHSLPQAERDPARSFAESLGVDVLTPRTHEMEREGYRANGGRPLLLLQGRAARRAHPAGGRARPGRTWPPAPTPTTRSPASGPASGRPRSAARSPRCATPGSPRPRSARPPVAGACRPGTSRRRPACPPGWPTASRSPRYRLARVERAEAAVRAVLGAARRTRAGPAGPRPR